MLSRGPRCWKYRAILFSAAWCYIADLFFNIFGNICFLEKVENSKVAFKNIFIKLCHFRYLFSALICIAAGILVSVKTREQQKLHKLKDSYDHLVQRVTELQELTDKLVSPCAENKHFSSPRKSRNKNHASLDVERTHWDLFDGLHSMCPHLLCGWWIQTYSCFYFTFYRNKRSRGFRRCSRITA